MTAVGSRDSIIGASGTRTVSYVLPAYYKEIRIGDGHTPNAAAFEVTNGILYIDNIYGGAGNFSNQYYDSYGCTATSVRNHEAFMGMAQNTGLSGTQSHGVRGQNFTLGTSGLIGVANGYDFYADGSGTNYGPFTGTHDALILPQDVLGGSIGDIVMDMECLYRRDVSNTLFRVKLAKSPPSPAKPRAALGVICSIKDWDDTHLIAALQTGLDVVTETVVNENGGSDDVHRSVPVRANEYDTLRNGGYKILAINALGEGMINVCGMNGDIVQDDLIVVSQMAGKGMKQNDDIVHSYTVARAREGCTFQNPTDVKTIACIYVSG